MQRCLVVAGFVLDVPGGLSDEAGGQAEPQGGEGQAEQEWGGPEAGGLCDRAGGPGGRGDGAVAGGLVEPHGGAASVWTDEVDLHDHGHRPGQPLVDAQQDVGDHDPTPRRRPDQQQRHGDRGQPAGQEYGLASEAVGERAGDVVHCGLGQPEHHDEGQHRGVVGDTERVLGQQRQDRAFLADHAADQHVDGDQQGELRQVLAQPQPDAGGVVGHARVPVSSSASS